MGVCEAAAAGLDFIREQPELQLGDADGARGA